MSALVDRTRGLTAEQELNCVNSIRVLSADMVEKANSGHPGAPMGCAPMAHVLFGSTMHFDPSDAKWFNRDRFVLSNGHACALLYSMLHLTGYNLSLDDLKLFRQFGSFTPGHPENFVTDGVEVSTGPLGQGISNAVGIAMAEKHLAAVYNKEGFNVVDHFTYVICGDGCLQEGVSSEASSLAGHLQLGKLIVLYDDNRITIDGNTNITFTEDVVKRYESYHWHVQVVEDGTNLDSLQAAVQIAKSVTDRPSMIKIRTVIGHGSGKEGSHGVHGSPLGAADLAAVKTKFGFNPQESFVVKPEAYDYYGFKKTEGQQLHAQWNEMLAAYAAQYPELHADLQRRLTGQLPANWKDKLPVYSHTEAKAAATRNRSEEVLNALAPVLPELVGGSADLTPSNLTFLKCTGDFQPATPAGRYIRFGIREHAMAAICNGMMAHGGVRPYCATFLNFIGYALGAVRVAALSQFGILYVMTHDSIGLGEDGPTHQPVEMLECLRATPNMHTFRPADGNETVGAYVHAIEHPHTPAVISLSRQATPTLEHSNAQSVMLGGYVMEDLKHNADALTHPTLTLIGTGTEVQLAIQTAKQVFADESAVKGSVWVRVVSMPCTELFDEQSLEYQKSILIPGSPVMSIEAAGTDGWKKYAHAPFGLQHVFGLSAPADKLYKHFGFSIENLTAKAKEVIQFYPNGAPSILDYPRFPTPKYSHHH